MRDKKHFAVYIKTDDSSFAKILVKLLRLLDKIQGAKHLICECRKKFAISAVQNETEKKVERRINLCPLAVMESS